MSNSGQKYPDRTSFVNVLSQYLKEKRNLGDFSVGITPKHESKGIETSRQQVKTMNFLANHVASSASNMKSLDFFPSNFGSSGSKEDTINKTDLRKQEAVEPKNAQLTIFFNGQVVVYDDFPSDKMKDIMAIANPGCSTPCSSLNVADSVAEKQNPNTNKIDHTSNSDIPDLNVVSATTTTTNSPAQDPSVERRHYVGGSDLRIARRNSLHKFFEKRKDRAAARAPYQLNNHQRGGPQPLAKSDENKPSCDIDLNL